MKTPGAELRSAHAHRIAMIAYTEYQWDPRVRAEAEVLAKEGNDITVIALRPRTRGAGLGCNEVRIEAVPLILVRGSRIRYAYQYGMFLLLSSAVLLRLHLRRRFDLVHVHSLPDFEVLSALPLRLLGVPVILDLHEALPEILEARFANTKNPVWFWLASVMERVSCAFASHVITANDGIRETIVARGRDPARVTTVYTPLEMEPKGAGEPDSRPGLPEGRLLVYAGGLNPERDLETYIRALSAVENAGDFYLVIAGDGDPAYRSRLERVAKDVGIDSRVLFVGQLGRGTARRLVSESEVGVVTLAANPLTEIAWPNRIGEFALVGKPLIVPNLRFIRKMVGEDAAYYTSGDPASLSRELRKLLTSPESYRAAAAGSRRLVARLEKYSATERLDGVYGMLIGPRQEYAQRT